MRLPQTDMHTEAMWWTLPEHIITAMSPDTLKNGMLGVANLLRIVAPLYLMCSSTDVAVIYQVKSPITDRPTIFLYDNCPGGIGLAQKAWSMQELLVDRALDIVNTCTCSQGCPSCCGPVGEIGQDGKATAARILKQLLEDANEPS